MMLLGTNDIRGITVCPSALNDNTYTIRTSMTDTISGILEGNNSTMIERNKERQKTYHLTVTDLNGVIVQSENITFSDNLCPTATGQDFYCHCIYLRKYQIGAITFTPEGPSESDCHGFSLSRV